MTLVVNGMVIDLWLVLTLAAIFAMTTYAVKRQRAKRRHDAAWRDLHTTLGIIATHHR